MEGSLWELLRRGTWAKGLTSILLATPRPWVGFWNEHATESPKACPTSLEIFLSFSGEWGRWEQPPRVVVRIK
uniref:Uncharacterized protein n=3 Tax=Macaca TaxID=9539 RepID=A0A5F7ZCH4_MACMU|nr:unnamed protein product [Macaca fascicularis]